MGTWRVETPDGRRWVQATGSAWTADPETEQDMKAMAGVPAPLAPMGETYLPASKADPVWVYLAARHCLGTGAGLTKGRPPELPPADPTTSPAGAVN
jgi:hypothetical protein